MPSSSAPLPTVGENNATADPKVRALLSELQGIVNGLTDNFEAGDMRAHARPGVSSGWLACDGAAVSRTTYAVLFAAIGTTYGAGDGSTTFNVPDLRGRVAVGPDGSAGRLTANDALGQSGGEEKHVLQNAEVGDHRHIIKGSSTTGAGNAILMTGNASSLDQQVTSEFTGTAAAHNNMQPYQVVNWEIRT